MQKALNINDVAIVFIKGSDYRIHFLYMSKDDAINIMKKWIIIKMDHKNTYSQRNREKMLNRAKKYNENNKE